jgi:hypothetical protein
MVQTAEDTIIGWDSLMTNGNEQTVLVQPKFAVRDGAVWGVTGILQALDVVMFADLPAYEEGDPRAWLVTKWVPAYKEALKSYPSLLQDNGDVQGFDLFVVVGGQAFSLDSGLHPAQSTQGVYTAGSGGDYARGVLHHKLQEFMSVGVDLDQNDVLDALRVAAAIDPWTGGHLSTTTAKSYIAGWRVENKS